MNVIYNLFAGLLIAIGLSSDIPYSVIQKGMESNDSHSIISLGKDKIVLQLPGTEGAFPLAQAEMILNSFFQKYPKGTFVFRYKNSKSIFGCKYPSSR